MAVIAILISFGTKDLNIAAFGNVAFAIGARHDDAGALLSFYWRGFNRTGAIAGVVGGLAISLGLTIIGPPVLGEGGAIFPLRCPPSSRSPPGSCARTWARSPAAGSRAGGGMPYDEFEARAFPPPGTPPADFTDEPALEREREPEPVA